MNLLGAYRASGGIDPGDVLRHLFEQLHRGDRVSLATLLVNGQAFVFAWSRRSWVPKFQFHAGDLLIKVAAKEVRAELPANSDGWAGQCH